MGTRQMPTESTQSTSTKHTCFCVLDFNRTRIKTAPRICAGGDPREYPEAARGFAAVVFKTDLDKN